MRYLSKEWKDAQWRAFEEEEIAGDTSNCGGQTIDYPPCGGCARCMTQQFGYYMFMEEQAANVILRAGLDVAMPTIRIDWALGYGGHHDAYNCWTSKERDSLSYPWENG